MGAIVDFSTGAAFFRNLTDQSFVQLETGPDGHLHLSLVEDMLSQPMLDKGQLQGFQAAAQVLERVNKQGQHPPSALADEGTSEVNREETDTEQTACLAASSHTNNTIANDICQHTRQVQTDNLQTGITSPSIPKHKSIWVQCSTRQQFLSLCQFDKTNMISMSRSEVDALKKANAFN